MKKIAFILANLLIVAGLTLCFTPAIFTANASVEYRRVITEDTPFYSDAAATDLLFYLPYTYYVKVIEQGENFSHVECFGTGTSIAIDGYVPTDKLFDDDLPVKNPYLEKEIFTVTNAVLYADKTLSSPVQYLFNARALKYYGQITSASGSVLFYVGYNNKLGYVEESAVSPFEIAEHPNELTFIIPEPPQDLPVDAPPPLEQEQEQPDDTTDNLTTVRIVVIVCLLLAGLIALFVAIKNKPRKQIANSYYDENEYE